MTIKNKNKISQAYLENNDLVADWEYWSKATSWTVTETAYLIHGIEPNKVLVEGSNHIINGLTNGISAFANAEKDFRLLERASKDGLIGQRNTPLEILNFCSARQIKVPLKLSEVCLEAGQSQIDAYATEQKVKEGLEALTDKTENKELGETERENLIRLIGILRNMLKDDTVISDLKRSSELFKKTSDLTDHISGHYKEDRENKGLSATKLNTIWAEAKRILKKDEDF